MILIWVVVILALCIPVIALVLDSPVGRAMGARLERGQPATPDAGEAVSGLQVQLALLEGEVDALRQELTRLREEQEFTARLLRHDPVPPTLPPAAE